MRAIRPLRGIPARREGRANLCGEVRATTVEAGEDVGALVAALQLDIINLIFPALVFLRSASALALSAVVCEPMHHVKWDCFVWLTDLDCGKASPLLRSSLDLGRIPAAPLRIPTTRARRADERGLRYKAYVTTTPRRCSSLDSGTETN
jgi:hypothetical protein